MLDYRTNLKAILQRTTGDERGLQNGLAAIKAIIAMAEGLEPVKKTAAAGKKTLVSAPKATAPVPAKNVQLQKLFLSLADVINNPGDSKVQQAALVHLHKLTFDPVIGKQYGAALGKLDQAVQNSHVTSATVNKKIFEQAIKPQKIVKRDYRKGRRYTVVRLVQGCDLLNQNGQTAYTVSEHQIHDLNLKTGDIVEATAQPADGYDIVSIIRVVGHQKMQSGTYDEISTFKYAVVQGRPNHLAVARDIHGKKLRINNKNLLLPIDASYFQNGEQVSDGSIVDLAWYSGDVRLKKNPQAAIKVRWVYELDQPHQLKNVKKTKKKTESAELPKLDLDLHYQRVGIAIGDNQNEAILEGIVARYNGIPVAIDAFQGKKKIVERQIKDLDIVILVTAFAAHDSTWNIREFASKYQVKFAVSSSKGYQAFERALYRAANGLPAYEGTQTIDYKKES